MATTRLLLGIIWIAATGGYSLFAGHLLARKQTIKEQAATTDLWERRMAILKTARSQIGVRERTGKNDGRRISAFLKILGLDEGPPWCAAFVSWVFAKNGFLKPRTAWSPDLFPVSRLARSALPGDVLGIYFPNLRRIAHVGIIEKMDRNWCISIEGNTLAPGSTGGEGVYRRRRRSKTIYRIADWVSPERASP